jgi:hypothetical protein
VITPPFELGAVHTSEIPPTVRDGVGAVGAEADPRNVTEEDGSEGSEVPAAFVAVTVNV